MLHKEATPVMVSKKEDVEMIKAIVLGIIVTLIFIIVIALYSTLIVAGRADREMEKLNEDISLKEGDGVVESEKE